MFPNPFSQGFILETTGSIWRKPGLRIRQQIETDPIRVFSNMEFSNSLHKSQPI